MTAKELMKPRFEVIADFPNNEFGKVGTILDRDWAKYENENEDGNIIWKLSDFPHLFRKLNWWEKRKVEDMPKRMICKGLNDDSVVFEIQEWDMKSFMGWTNKEERIMCSLTSFKPEYGYFPVDWL